MGKASASALKVQGLFEKHCLVTLAFAQKELGLSLPTYQAYWSGRNGLIR
jgi:hypothetical protein